MKNKKPKLLILITSIIAVLFLSQLAISYNLATTGGKMRQLEEKSQKLEDQKRLLAEDINRMGSLSMIAEKAQAMGLVKVSGVLHLTPQVPVALETNSLNPNR